ncbi:MAG: type 2 isopentenyl-diphosphate Delta-isomerase [Myxococcota bacterium]|nr:type 2 isopentenyl-diphosphate Delta-isomerase [Myxococcota bacterium]
MSTEIGRRKDEHLELASSDAVAFRERTTLLEEVALIHESLPELSVEEVDLGVELLGKTLRAPILIASMTGGTDRAGAINRELASIAEARGYGIGLGSQRAMQRDPAAAATFRVRDVAPTALLLGNLGVVQARDQPTSEIQKLLDEVGADALFVHMNPAQELVQPGGDRDFRGGLETFARLVGELKVPVVAKETGCGVSARVAQALREVGVETVDVSGAGGTSWVAVEALRASGAAKQLGETLWDWGIPTAVSVSWVARAGLAPIATGGIKTGLDVARAIALGARAAGIARPVLQALQEGGRAGAEAYLDRVESELRAVMLLTGSSTLDELRSAPRVIGPELARWIAM